MNNRQKAKRFKQLYEMSLRKNVPMVVYESRELKRHEYCYALYKRNMVAPLEAEKQFEVYPRMVEKCGEVLRDLIEIEETEDYYMFRIEFWTR